MARQPWQFQPGNSGRPFGATDKKKALTKTLLSKLATDKKFYAVLLSILRDPTHQHWRFTVEFVFNHVLGKPVESVHQTSDGSLPAPQFQVAFLDFDEFFAQEELVDGQVLNGHAQPQPD